MRWLANCLVWGILVLASGDVFTRTVSAAASNETQKVVVRTASGPVQGEKDRGLQVFRGIPFAAPPVGRLRFRPPAPPIPWNEVRPAHDFAPACPQLLEDNPASKNNVMAEDCLALNIWTPSADNKNRPVMVWIHGGGWVAGSARGTWYDGTALASRGDVVVVTLQYRLGPWGFLELSEAGGHDYAQSANLGLLDQVEALKWVHRNIAAFGGDSNNVTVFGVSAGAASAGSLMAMPVARGLFHKAIMESGTPWVVGTEARAGEVSRAYLKVAGVSSIEQLQRLTMVQLRDAEKKLLDAFTEGTTFRPTVDSLVLKEPPVQTIADGRAAAIPTLIGTNLDEMRLWPATTGPALDRRPMGLLEAQVTELVGSRAQDVIATYRKADADNADAVIHLLGDLLSRMPSIRIAEANSRRQATYMYLFTYRSTSTHAKYGACHVMEVPFVFGVLDAPQTIAFTGDDPRREALSRQIQQAWINFARTGDPSQIGLAWSKWDGKTRATMELGIPSQIVNDPYPAQRTAWNGLPFDGISPSSDKLWALVYENGTP